MVSVSSVCFTVLDLLGCVVFFSWTSFVKLATTSGQNERLSWTFSLCFSFLNNTILTSTNVLLLVARLHSEITIPNKIDPHFESIIRRMHKVYPPANSVKKKC